MNTQPKEVKLYRTSDGHCPFEEWLARLKDNEAEMRIDIRLGRLQRGNPGDVKAVGEGVSELRVDYGPGYRVYFGQVGATLVILLCAGSKRTQTADIKRAKKYWADYQQRAKERETKR